jgi:L-alanine-DL-glutamate epimerase-like enolase superfamily enzyme
MKVTGVEAMVCDAGWRPWIFIKITTDRGIAGYGECTDNRSPRAILGCIDDLKPLVIGRDPRHVEMIYWDLYRATRHSVGGVVQKGIAGINCALWDIKAKELGVPVYALFGGPTRDRVRLYWTHFATYRIAHGQHLGTPPIKSLDDIAELAVGVVEQGYTALKTNLLLVDENSRVISSGFSGGYGTTDRNLERTALRRIEALMGTIRGAVGDDMEVAIDLNFNFTTVGFTQVAQALEPFDLAWIEMDTYDPHALRQIKGSTSIPVCSGESLYTTRGYRPYFELHAMDIPMVDVPWNGLSAAKKVADMAEAYELNICPHNYYSHLSTFMSAHLCACIPNVRIMEIEVDDVPWKDDIVTSHPLIEDGEMLIPSGAGWGVDLDEQEIARHPWPRS